MAQATNDGPIQPEQPPKTLWGTSCSAVSRSAALDCVMEQRVIITETWRLLVGVKVRVEGAGRTPALMVQTPLGLFMPSGVTLRVDSVEPEKLDVQTCDAAGCYAGMAMSAEFVALMVTGRELLVSFQDLARQDVNVTVSLQGFSAGFQMIK
jgi:invasion protein IalB